MGMTRDELMARMSSREIAERIALLQIEREEQEEREELRAQAHNKLILEQLRMKQDGAQD